MKLIDDIMDAMGIVDEVEEKEIPHKSREERLAKAEAARAAKAAKEVKAAKEAEAEENKVSTTDKIKGFFKKKEEPEEVAEPVVEEPKKEAPSKRRLNFNFSKNKESEASTSLPAPVAKKSTLPSVKPARKPAMPPYNAGSVDMQMIEPTSFDDSQKVADCLHNNEAVIVNFENTDPIVAKRMTDFISGTIYALQGNMKKIGRNILICAPKNVDIDSGVSSYVGREDEF